jgi:ABC-type lipoprotein release transport system permease subunit
MTILRLAVRNLLGGGMKSWLNAVVLSIAFVAIIWTQGLYQGMDNQVSRAIIDAAAGGGQYWMETYDPFDPFTLQDAHLKLTGELDELVKSGKATPVLIIQGTIYPGGRIQSVLLKGIDPEQKLLSFPSSFLKNLDREIPALIGRRVAQTTGLKTGDTVTVRWRDAHGTFDARDLRIVQVMSTSVQTIDVGQIWVPLQKLQEMASMPNEATIVITEKNFGQAEKVPGWTFRDLNFLLKDIQEFVKSKTIGASIFYSFLLFLAMLAIFNTQVLSIFRRRKEIGTLMALGLPRGKVIELFTVEGALHAILAALVGAVYGIPLLAYFVAKGWPVPSGMADSFGFALSEKLFPTYSAGLVVGTTILVLIITTIVSFLPTRKIAKLKPTDALRGRLP